MKRSIYKGKEIYWSESKNRWQYAGNNRPVTDEEENKYHRSIFQKILDYFNLNLRYN
jgi:hypothetical protein